MKVHLSSRIVFITGGIIFGELICPVPVSQGQVVLGTYGLSQYETAGYNASVSVTITTSDNRTQTYNTTAGEFTLTFTGTSRPEGYGDSFKSYCVDLYQYSANMTAAEARTFPTAALTEDNPYWVAYGGQKAAYLYNTYWESARTDSDKANKCAALQVAIWKALYESAVSFTLSTAIQEAAFGTSGYYTLANSVNWGGYQYQSTWWHSIDPNSTPQGFGGRGQDFIGPVIVPEPAEMAMVGVGFMMICLGYNQYRLRRQVSKAQ